MRRGLNLLIVFGILGIADYGAMGSYIVTFRGDDYYHSNITKLVPRLVRASQYTTNQSEIMNRKINEYAFMTAHTIENCTDGRNVTDYRISRMRAVERNIENYQYAVDNAARIIGSFFIFFCKLGFMVRHIGMVTSKNLKMTITNELICGSLTYFGWWLSGWGIAFGADSYPERKENGLMGQSMFYGQIGDNLDSSTAELWSRYLLHMEICMVVTSIPPGSSAERAKLSTNVFIAFITATFIYPIIVHLIWDESGWLSSFRNTDLIFNCGAIDHAGSAVVHITGGVTAFMGAAILGPRVGRWLMDTSANKKILQAKPQASPAFEAFGTFILLGGFTATNGFCTRYYVRDGHVAAKAMVNTLISSGVSSVLSVFLMRRSTGVQSLQIACGGLMAGQAASASGCAVMTGPCAAAVGMLSALIYSAGGSVIIDLGIDDVSQAVSIHLFSGIWGCLATGLFAEPTLVDAVYGKRSVTCYGVYFGGGVSLIAAQGIMVSIVIVWAGATTAFFYYFFDLLIGGRFPLYWEAEGMDFYAYGGKNVEISLCLEQDKGRMCHGILTNSMLYIEDSKFSEKEKALQSKAELPDD